MLLIGSKLLHVRLIFMLLMAVSCYMLEIDIYVIDGSKLLHVRLIFMLLMAVSCYMLD